jgi:hypothetical protein
MKKFRISLLSVSFLLIVLLVSWQDHPKPDSYDHLWHTVKQYADKDLYKSALKTVQLIYSKAQKEGNESQIVKSLVVRISLQSKYQENFPLQSMRLFQKAYRSALPVEKQLLSSLLGQLYQGYFDAHRGEIFQRKTAAASDTALETLNARQWEQKIQQAYLASLSAPEKLAAVPLQDFSAVLYPSDSLSFLRSPSLYDLLANRAIRYFSSAGDAQWFPQSNWKPDTSLFAPADVFLKKHFHADSASPHGEILRLFQHLLQWHSYFHQPEAFMDVNLRRLQFVKTLLPNDEKNNLSYAHALERMFQQYKNQPVSVRLAAMLSSAYLSLDRFASSPVNYRIKAERTCTKALKAFPSAPFSNRCRNMVARIHRPEFSMKLPQATLPAQPFLAFIEYQNTPALWFKVVKIPASFQTKAGDNQRQMVKTLLRKPAVKQWKQTFPLTEDLRRHTAEVAMPALTVGSYLVFVADNAGFSSKSTVLYRHLQATRIALLSQNNLHAQAWDVFLRDRATGLPINGGQVRLFARTYNYRMREQRINFLGDFTANDSGFLQIPRDSRNRNIGYLFEAIHAGDTSVVNTSGGFYGSVFAKKPVRHTYLFTDRAIYRPGQTVYFKAVEVETQGNDAHVIAGEKVQVQLLNAQYHKIETLSLVTDVSGSVNGSFVLPDEALNGRFNIKTAYGMTPVLVENYKRPAFHVVFDTVKKAYVLNDSVTLTGKVVYYFGGHPDHLPVKYTVRRESYFPFPFYGGRIPFVASPGRELAGGTVRTDSAGRFRVTFKALSDAAVPAGAHPVYRFVLHAVVADASGETHTATKELRLSELSVLLKLSLLENLIKEQAAGVTISTTNLSGNEVPATVHINLYKLVSPRRYFFKRLWPKPDTILMDRENFAKTFPHLAYAREDDKNQWPKTKVVSVDMPVQGKALIFSSRFQSLKTGEYLLEAYVKGERKARIKKFLTLSSVRSKKVPAVTAFWHNLSADRAEPGTVLQLMMGSSMGKIPVLYEVLNGRQVVRRSWITVGKKLLKLSIPVQESFRGNFVIRLTAIVRNRLFVWSKTVQVPFSNKKLLIGLESFRNYLKPGEKEHWTLKIHSLDGTPQPAFVLAGMYDASLDVYARNQWKMFPFRTKTAGPLWRSYLFASAYHRTLYHRSAKMLPEVSLTYPDINWFGYPVFARQTYGVMMKSARQEVLPAPVHNDQTLAAALPEQKTDREMTSDLPPEKKPVPQPLRTDFNETAFFYPDLHADASGKVSFSFTTPDALTQWKLMVMAYTQKMKTGTYVRNFVARKALMIIPNLPRFVREGDRLLFTARLSSSTDKTLPVTVKISFFNPETGHPLPLLLHPENVQRQVTLLPGKNQLVSWWIQIPEGLPLVAYRIRAVAGDFSDGEERMIPVLSHRVLVTESLPMFVRGGQKKTFSFRSLLQHSSKTRKNFRYTLTFTSHPAWYALQALPYLGKPEYQSTENLFYRFYAHALAGKLLKTYPRIRQVFDQWKQASPDAFLSALQKNKALKDVVLQATPWMLDARNETEQKRRLALFFDLNQMQHQQQAALNKLQSTQMPSGAWPWFPGMPADFYTTTNILSGMTDLVQSKAVDLSQQPDLKNMLQKGMRYLDHQMLLQYDRIKKQYPQTLAKNHLTAQQVRYCYLRSAWLQAVPLPDKQQHMVNYFISQIKKYWPGLNNNLLALSAMTLNRTGQRYQAEAIIRALNEKSLTGTQHEMYWRSLAFPGADAIATEVNIMKAFVEVMQDVRSADRMKTWLILQKQAQYWPGSRATANAVYALLMYGSPMLTDTQPAEVVLGNGEKWPSGAGSTEAGTGYFEKVWNGEEITPSLGKIQVENPHRGMAYGAAYLQYFEDINKVVRQSTNVSIQKALFREVITSQGSRWEPVTGKTQLHTGDKVMVRLVIRSQRAVDFVHVQDMHAACLEPETVLSGYRRDAKLDYYEEIKDATTHFFIRHLSRGTFVLEYPLLVSQRGVFTNGIARIQSLYLPSFNAHSSGREIKVQ